MIRLLYLLLFANLLSGQTTINSESAMNASGSVNKEVSSISGVLTSDGPSLELGSVPDLYSWLIGSWDARIIDYGENGSKREQLGEWHFAWVLEGRAVQDVLVVPARDLRSPSSPKEGNRYGTSIRVYDPTIDAWKITWINPVRNIENHLTGRKVGKEIIQEGVDTDGALMRWCFRDIQPNSFHWTGEQSTDQGKTWQLGAEFYCVRKIETQR